MGLAAVILCLFITLPAHAMTAAEYFDDGNRLYRDNLYWAALLRYRQASEAGMDTPLLHYNMGVAHYRANQHIRAREELLGALESPTLRLGAQYSLGLNAYALGNVQEALDWFRLARDQNQNRRISEYARIAISRIHAGQLQEDPIVLQAERVQRERDFANLQFRTRIGFGTDDNIFRSPSDPYVDFSDPALPVVTPVVQSGAFMPLNMSAKYFVNAYDYEGFFGAYRLSGRYYQDKELQNGNEYIHQLSFGSEYRRKNEEANRERRVFSAFKIAQHDEVYYDPDTGDERQIGAVDVSDRMNYLRYGPELRFRQSHERLSLGFVIKGQLWNYESVDAGNEYDHEYFLFGANTQYRFGPTSLLRIELSKYSRRFGDRPSFELDGTQPITAPSVRYDYLEAALIARQRLFGGLWFGVEYERTDRKDQYVGYNNYIRDSYGAEIHWLVGNRFEVEIEGFYRLYNYENAFAFHNPAAGRKTLEAVDGRLEIEYRMTRSLSLVLEGEFRERESTDTRIAYERLQLLLGVRWEP